MKKAVTLFFIVALYVISYSTDFKLYDFLYIPTDQNHIFDFSSNINAGSSNMKTVSYYLFQNNNATTPDNILTCDFYTYIALNLFNFRLSGIYSIDGYAEIGTPEEVLKALTGSFNQLQTNTLNQKILPFIISKGEIELSYSSFIGTPGIMYSVFLPVAFPDGDNFINYYITRSDLKKNFLLNFPLITGRNNPSGNILNLEPFNSNLGQNLSFYYISKNKDLKISIENINIKSALANKNIEFFYEKTFDSDGKEISFSFPEIQILDKTDKIYISPYLKISIYKKFSLLLDFTPYIEYYFDSGNKYNLGLYVNSTVGLFNFTSSIKSFYPYPYKVSKDNGFQEISGKKILQYSNGVGLNLNFLKTFIELSSFTYNNIPDLFTLNKMSLKINLIVGF